MINVRNVHKNFGSNRVLRGVTIDVHDGETLTIIGGSGSGKSVFLKHLVRLSRPDAGEILVDGVNITKAQSEDMVFEVQNKFGFLFQGAALFDSMSVGENVAFGLRNLKRNLSDREVRDTVREKLDLVGLGQIEEMPPAELSGGMRKRVGLARAIAHAPKYIVYDEPTTGLDPITGDMINDLIRRLQERLGVTSIVVTHDIVSAYKISDRIAMLYEGKIIDSGTPDEIKKTDNLFVRQFVTGSSQGPIKVKLKVWD